MVIHGGIDGHKRLIVYLKCSNYNRAATVGQCFIEPTERFGWPSPVRSDKGDENIDVASNRGSHIADSSDPVTINVLKDSGEMSSVVSVPCKLYFIQENKHQNFQNMYAKLGGGGGEGWSNIVGLMNY